MVERRLIAVEGVVQGVGFRPYVHRLAAARNLRGFVRNDSSGVLIDVEGDPTHLDEFCQVLTREPPPTATIARTRVEAAEPRAYAAFHIAESLLARHDKVAPFVPSDVATCDACLEELFDPSNRRFEFPFITCTDCGPRFTIVRETPYDRERTTMAGFTMCPECRREYESPHDRRFHAEAIACQSCGPALAAARGPGREVNPGHRALAVAIDALRAGEIVALKALGGYHLACDATSATSVDRLRTRKRRAAKPFALMVRDITAAAELGVISPMERRLLESPARPVVLLERREHAGVAASVAPAQARLGVMLPSTPLHHLLLAALDCPLVMTSGNRSDEPVATTEEDAFSALGDIADLFLTHDRPIAARCDDSVVGVAAGAPRSVRRARGYVPRTITLAVPASRPVLAVGGHLKNTVCVASGAHALLSAHVGDLESHAARIALRDAIETTIRFAGVTPSVVAHDLHPDYASTRVAAALAAELGIDCRVPVQHHHAHVAACVAEFGVREPVIGVAFDGAGLGSDGEIWGGEFLLVDGAGFRRCGHLAYVRLPGGDAAARGPWRAAAAHVASAVENDERDAAATRPAEVADAEWRVVWQLLDGERAIPRTSSVGRLFDAVASLLGICHVARFEGEAAMALEAAANVSGTYCYPVTLSDGACWTADTGEIIRGVLDDRKRGRSVAGIAGAFHRSLRDLVVAGCERTRAETGLSTVVLTGGVFMNSLLLTQTHEELSARRFRVLIPQQVPCNDGGLSLGQAYVAARALEEGPCA